MDQSAQAQEFWNRLYASGFIAPEKVQELHQQFYSMKGALNANSQSIAQWLTAQNLLSEQQARSLLSPSQEMQLPPGVPQAQAGPQAQQAHLPQPIPQAGAAQSPHPYGNVQGEGFQGGAVQGGMPGQPYPGTGPTPQGFAQPGAAGPAIREETSVAEIERRREEAMNRQLKQWVLVAVITGSILLLGLIIYNTFFLEETGDELTPPATNLESEEVPEPEADPLGNPPAEKPPAEEGGDKTEGAVKVNGSQAEPIADVIYAPQQPLHPSPTDGRPLDLRHLAGGAQMIVALRPADLLAQPEGQKTWTALGPWGNGLQHYLEQRLATPVANIEQVLIGILDIEEGVPQLSLVVRTRAPLSREKVTAASGGLAVHFADAGNRLVAIGPADQADDLKGEHPYFLRPEFEELLGQTDDARQVSILFAPHFPLAGGKEMLSAAAGPQLPLLQNALSKLAYIQGNDLARAALVSLHVDESGFYSELRVHGGSGQAAAMVAAELHNELTQIPFDVLAFYRLPEQPDGEQHFIPSKEAQPLVARYPKMLQAWTAYLRTGTRRRHAVLTSRLPAKAAHNLALATQAALRDPGHWVGGKVKEGPQFDSLSEKLAGLKIDLVFPQDSFNRTVMALGEEHGFQVKFADFEEAGITKQKAISMNVREKTPLGKVLAEICRKSNPAISPGLDSPEQSLVFVVDDARNTVVFTNRRRASQYGEPWPAFGIK